MVSDKKIFSCFLNISLCKTCNLRGGHIYGPRDIISTKLLLTFLFFVTPIVEHCNCSMFSYTLLYVHSSIAIILMGKRELVALLNSSFWCLVMVERLFLAVPWGCLGFVIVVFPDHTHLLFLVEVGYLLLNTKNQGSMPCGFRQEDLKVFISKI